MHEFDFDCNRNALATTLTLTYFVVNVYQKHRFEHQTSVCQSDRNNNPLILLFTGDAIYEG